MASVREMSEDELFKVIEQPGSAIAYEKERETARRVFVANSELRDKQIEAANAQILAANAIVQNGRWIKRSAVSVIIGTIIAVSSFALSVFNAM